MIVELLKGMIENGELRARLNEQKKTIMFIKSDEDYDDMKEKVVDQTDKIRKLMQELKDLEDDIVVSKEYQKKIIKGSEFNYDDDDL
jgi:predicted  nucleic acid-binding Zn-ribbon protein